jgi:hypothetical protein
MSLPNPATHVWSDEHIGGATNDPRLLLLEEENLMTNGDFESALSGWANSSGTAPTRVDLGSDAARGNYAMNLKASSITHWYKAFTGTKILLSGFVKFVATDAAGSCDIDLYITANTSYAASPASKFVSLTLNSVDAYVTATGYFMPFYLELEATAGSYVHINIGNDSGVEVYIDDLRLHEVTENLALEEPTLMTVTYQRIMDAEFELYNKTDKAYLRGWRPVFNVRFDYIAAAELVKNIKGSESMFNFFIPHSDNLFGGYVRMIDDFSPESFNGRYFAHSQDISFRSIFLYKFKPREYAATYFSAASA